MSDAEPDYFVAEAIAFRKSHPAPITFQALIKEVHEKTGRRPSRTGFRDALRNALPDAAAWVADLDDAPVVGDAKNLLEQWLANPSDRTSKRNELRKALDREPDSSPVVHAARALGAADGPVAWDLIVPDRLSKELRQEVIDAGLRSEKVDWVLDAICFSSAPISKSTKEQLVSAHSDFVAKALSTRLREMPRAASGDARTAEGLVRLLSIATQFKGTATVNAALIGMSAAEAKRPAPKWVQPMAVLVASSNDDLTGFLNELSRAEVDQVLRVLAGLPGAAESPRMALVRAIAASNHCAALADREAWRGVTIEVIGDLLDDDAVGPRLLEVATETVIEPLTRREAETTQAWRVLMLVGRWPHLAPFVTPSHLLHAAERSDRSAELLRRLLEQAQATSTDLTAELVDRIGMLETDLAASRADAEAARNAAVNLQETIDDLRGLLGEQSRQGRAAIAAEINQGRVDTLREMIDIIERVRPLASLSETLHEPAASVVRDATFVLTKFGVKVAGEPGTVRRADARLDEPFSPNALVEIITPAYLLESNVTPLRRSFVRVLEEA